MKYGLDNYVLIAPFSLIISLLMFMGIFYIGKKFLIITKFDNLIETVSGVNYQSILIGSIVSSVFFFPLILFNIQGLFLIKIFSYLLVILGCLFIFDNKNFINNIQIKKYLKKDNLHNIIIFILITSYLLLSLGPVTNADSLDYHIGVPLHLLSNEGNFPSHNYFHAVAFGSGEIINLIGLTIGAEAFAPLIQFGGILSITGILKKSKLKESLKSFIIVLAITSPVYIFLVTSSKPQLLYIGCSALAFSLIFFNEKLSLRKNNTKFITLICFFLLIPITAKFSFALGSGLLFLILAYKAFKDGFFIKLIIISSLVFLIFLFPQIIWRLNTYGGNIFSAFFPIPTHLFGYTNLANSLTTCGYHGCIPYWIFIPKSLSEFTECLGFGCLIIFFFKDYKNNKLRVIIMLVLIYSLFAHKFGPNIARYYIDPLVWLSIAASRLNFGKTNFLNISWKLTVYLQGIIVFIGIIYGIFTLTVGTINNELRSNVMANKASGYSIHKWASSILPNDSIVLTSHRSISILERKTIYIDFMTYLDPQNKKSNHYFDLVKESKPTHIIFYDNKKYFNHFENCVNKLEYYGKNVGNLAGRNPFKKSKKYDGYIYSIDYKLLPDCIRN